MIITFTVEVEVEDDLDPIDCKAQALLFDQILESMEDICARNSLDIHDQRWEAQ